MLNRDARARMQAPPRAALRRSLGLRGGNYAGRRLDSTTKEEGDWPSTGGEETDLTLPERGRLFFRSAPQAAWSILCFRDGGEGEPIGIECQREQVIRSGPSEVRR